jgi:uncharacterized protein YkwD
MRSNISTLPTSPKALRLAFALLAAASVTSFVAGPAAAMQAPTEPEALLLSLANDARATVDRVPLRWDGRLADVAQDRSDDMAASGVFAHANVVPMIEAKGVIWYYLAELLVKGTPREPLDSAAEAMRTWRDSPSHWNLLSSAEFNYVGFGVARASDGWYYWTAVLVKGPDRTAPTAAMTDATLGPVAGTTRNVTLSWTGADVALSAMNSGLRDFRVQRKVGSGLWQPVTDWTTATSRTFSVTVGKTYRFRVRARDGNGNRSTWSVALTVSP